MAEREAYQHKVQYYETDQMGIVHHSNYIRWFEEARTDYMDCLGMGYARMEEMGILSPVLSVSADYLRMVYFGDTVSIDCYIKETPEAMIYYAGRLLFIPSGILLCPSCR